MSPILSGLGLQRVFNISLKNLIAYNHLTVFFFFELNKEKLAPAAALQSGIGQSIDWQL